MNGNTSLKSIMGGERTDTSYIGLCGRMSLDLAFYLGQILTNLQKKVLIADLTKSTGLAGIRSHPDRFPVSARGVDYTDERFVTAKGQDCYDFVFVCLITGKGYNGFHLMKQVYYISDTEADHLALAAEEIKSANRISGMILRDFPDHLYSPEYFFRYLAADDYLLNLYRQKRIFLIPLDEQDTEYRLKLQYEPSGKFRDLSEGFVKVLTILAGNLTDCGQKDIVRAFKYAKEGKVHDEYHILERGIGKNGNQRKYAGGKHHGGGIVFAENGTHSV